MIMSTDMHEPSIEQPTSPPRNSWRNAPLSRLPKGGPDGGRVGGVVAGLSRAYGFDLRTTRIAVAVATIILPVLAVVYLAAWVLLPDSPEQAQPIDAIVRDRRRFPILAVIALVIVVGGVGSFGSWFLFRGAPWGLVLIGLGVLLWMSTRDRSPWSSAPSTPTGPSASTPTTPSVSSASTATTGDAGVGFPPPTPAVNTAPMPAVRVMTKRVRRPIASIGAGVMVLWFAIVGIGNALDWWQVDNLWVVVTGLSVVLTALLVSIVVNRSWVLPFVFLPLLGALVMLCVAQPDIDGPSGTRSVVPTTVAEAEARQHLATGQLTIDLRQMVVDGAAITVDAEVGMGQLRIIVPDDLDLVLRTDIGAGVAMVDGTEIADGIRQVDTRTLDARSTPADGSVVLDLRVGMGQIAVERVASGT